MRGNPHKRELYTGNKFLILPLPYNYKEIELSEDLKYGMEWVLRDDAISLNQEKEPPIT